MKSFLIYVTKPEGVMVPLSLPPPPPRGSTVVTVLMDSRTDGGKHGQLDKASM